MSNGCFLALGDSLTQGVGDELPDGSHLGWVRRLAEMLEPSCGELEIVNLAAPHARAPQVRIKQLPAVIEDRALLASVIIGMNDALGTFSPESFRRDYEVIVARLTMSARIVLTATLADVSSRLGLPAESAAVVRAQITQANAVIREISARYRTVCLEAADVGEPARDGLWLADGLHPNSSGHQEIAEAFAVLLEKRLGETGGTGETGETGGHLDGAAGRARVDSQRFASLAIRPRREVIAGTLATDAELWTPASPRPFTGRATVARVLEVFLRDVITDIAYRRKFESPDAFCMNYSGQISGVGCEGVDIVQLDEAGLIERCTVFLRPLPAVVAMSRCMATGLQESGIQIDTREIRP